MSITLYTAPDCLRCKIVKAFLDERGQGVRGLAVLALLQAGLSRCPQQARQRGAQWGEEQQLAAHGCAQQLEACAEGLVLRIFHLQRQAA